MKLIPNYFEQDEMDVLCNLATEYHLLFEEGRKATGYGKLDVRNRKFGGRQTWVRDLVARSLSTLSSTSIETWDAWILWYPDGSHIPPHVDPPEVAGSQHHRLNVLIKEPKGGGVFYFKGKEVSEFTLGSAIVFNPAEAEHSVSPVVGDRYIWSVGILI